MATERRTQRGGRRSAGEERVSPLELQSFVAAIFAASGSSRDESELLAEHLVEANLLGHDSHGVMRVARYIEWLEAGHVKANRHARVVADRGPILIVDGDRGYGQVIAREAMALAAERARLQGMAALALRNTGHLGRIGAWAEQLAAAGLVSYHWVNTSGFGILVAPHGGSDRRLSANPIAAGLPVPGKPPLILDIATSAVAEGKLQIARNKGEKVAPGLILDGAGRPTTDPQAFYGDPPGALLPIAGHKGSGLSFFCEVLAGALTGGASSHPRNPTAKHLVNNMLTLAFDPVAFVDDGDFTADVERLIVWTKASPPAEAGGEVLLPGEIEQRTRAARERDGVPLDPETHRQLAATATRLGVATLRGFGG